MHSGRLVAPAMAVAAPALAQKQGGILRVFHRDSPASMSLLEEGGISAIMPMMGVFNNLVLFDQHLPQNRVQSIVPDLATSWTSNEEGTELTFTLRDGVKWHDGKPFTAADVKCTYALLTGRAKEKLRLNYREAWFLNLDGVTTNGDSEVVLHLKRPQPAFLSLLASGYSPIYPCHISAPDRRTHPVGTGPFKFVECNPNQLIKAGWWDGLIGPGKEIDTEKLFVVSSNMLGSSFGSTNGASVNPDTGKPCGPDFPAITVRDIVAAEKALLDELGVGHLVAVAGPSYGGYQAFQWAVSDPDFMDAIVPVVSAPRPQNLERSLAELTARLAADPEWNGGRYYDSGGGKTVPTELRVEMLKRNGIEASLAKRYPDRDAREAAVLRQAVDWAERWDASYLMILRRGTIGYDTVNGFREIKAKVLYVLCRTDRLFPPSIAPAVTSGASTLGGRQRTRSLGKRARARQMVAGASRASRPADDATGLAASSGSHPNVIGPARHPGVHVSRATEDIPIDAENARPRLLCALP